jgi:formylmethanofuran dehydrogenase subunit E
MLEPFKRYERFLTYQQGKYRLIVETTGSSVLTLNKDNVIGGIQVSIRKEKI